MKTELTEEVGKLRVFVYVLALVNAVQFVAWLRNDRDSEGEAGVVAATQFRLVNESGDILAALHQSKVHAGAELVIFDQAGQASVVLWEQGLNLFQGGQPRIGLTTAPSTDGSTSKLVFIGPKGEGLINMTALVQDSPVASLFMDIGEDGRVFLTSNPMIFALTDPSTGKEFSFP